MCLYIIVNKVFFFKQEKEKEEEEKKCPSAPPRGCFGVCAAAA